MKKFKNLLWLSASFLLAFVLWTMAVIYIDVAPIGPQNTKVGLATLNSFLHNQTGVHLSIYNITDWLGLVPFGFVLFFGIVGLSQWIRRKNILNVDSNILILGVFYIVTFAFYILFEYTIINYRPILINGNLEASYPSSTTMLVLCVIPTAIMQINWRLKCSILKLSIQLTLCGFIVFMVIGRLISGVHWFSDIVGGVFLSAGLVTMYYYVTSLTQNKFNNM